MARGAWHKHHYRTGFLNTLSVLLLSYSYICGRTLTSDGRLPGHVTRVLVTRLAFYVKQPDTVNSEILTDLKFTNIYLPVKSLG